MRAGIVSVLFTTVFLVANTERGYKTHVEWMSECMNSTVQSYSTVTSADLYTYFTLYGKICLFITFFVELWFKSSSTYCWGLRVWNYRWKEAPYWPLESEEVLLKCREHWRSKISQLAHEIFIREESSAGNEGPSKLGATKGYSVSPCRETLCLGDIFGNAETNNGKANTRAFTGYRLQQLCVWSRRTSHLNPSASCLVSFPPFGIWFHIFHKIAGKY